MDENIANSLRKAVDLLKAGDANGARMILVEILRQDSENEQSWYMLSFAVPNRERQVYALEQVLRINPNNDKAKSRLRKIKGPRERGGQSRLEPGEQPAQAAKPESRPLVESPVEEEGDLLSRRLFGDAGGDAEESKSKAPSDESPQPVQFGTEPSEEQIEEGGRKKKKKKKEKKPRKKLLSRIPRRTLVLLVLIAIVGGSAVVFFPEALGLPLAGVSQGEEPTETAEVGVTPSTEPSETPEPASTESGLVFPPTWTLISGGDEGTPQGHPTTGPVTVDLNIPTPAAEVQEEMGRIQSAAAELRGIEDVSGERAFLAPGSRIQNALQSFSQAANYRIMISNMELTYRALGLIDPTDTLDGYPQNLWVEPNGGLYVPDDPAILVSGLSFGALEKYLYVQETGQDLINDEFDINGLGIYPFCQMDTQSCDAVRALLKGDATFLAQQWLEELATEDEQLDENAQVKYLIVPIPSPPVFLEQDLLFPYTQGLEFVERIYEAGGWNAVNDLYAELPTTTEQILHPEKYLSGEGALPVDDPSLGGVLEGNWREIFDESLGEWKTFMLLTYSTELSAAIEETLASEAAAGWGGDHVQIYYDDFNGGYTLSAHWLWDTQSDADQFFSVFSEYFNARYEGGEPVEIGEAICWQQFDKVSCLYQDETDIYWFVAPDLDAMNSIFDLFELS